MALTSVNTKIQAAITAINAGTDDVPTYCGYLLSYRGRQDTYIQKGGITLPALIQFIDGVKEVVLKSGEKKKTIEFYFFNSISKLQNDPENVDMVYETLKTMLWEFFRNCQAQGLQPEFVGESETLIEQVAAAYDAGILFKMSVIEDATC